MASKLRWSLASGVVDGVNKVFDTPLDYVPGTVVAAVDGFICLPQVVSELGGKSFEMDEAPTLGCVVGVVYRSQS